MSITQLNQTPETTLENEAANSRFFNTKSYSNQHVLTADQFSPAQLEELFSSADELRIKAEDPDERRVLASRYVGKQVCSLFYQPSTRTRLSFEQAAAKFGMVPISTENAREFSSAAKGETITDTIRVLNEYDFAAIVLRHHETGSAAQAAAVSKTPIINAGDGKGEHPTQALLDTYTIYENKGRLDNLKVVMGGDLKNGRTVRSLTQLLAKYPDNHFTFVSVPEFQMEDDIKSTLRAKGTPFEETEEMFDALRDADVVYWTRLQREHLGENESQKVHENAFILNALAYSIMSKNAVVMHPLPRVGEIDPEVDSDSRSIYFRQAGNGLYMRMALLDKILDRSIEIEKRQKQFREQEARKEEQRRFLKGRHDVVNGNKDTEEAVAYIAWEASQSSTSFTGQLPLFSEHTEPAAANMRAWRFS